MRIGVYGGSFNPPHVGHAMVASWLLWTQRVEEVWLVPAGSHPFDKTLDPFVQRLALCEAMAGALDFRIKVSAVEGDLPAPNYTYDTLCHLRTTWRAHDFSLVIGSDVLEQVHLWHRWEDIEAQFSPIVVGREGFPGGASGPIFPGVSSSDIRERLSRDESVEGLVHASVLALLRE